MLSSKLVDTSAMMGEDYLDDIYQCNDERPLRRRQMMKVQDGEVVEVQDGYVIRSTGRKDRHSKVCTAKGPRDRRVRLSAHTAIQFYDVQDRLGYDRPSKTVDWLIMNAKPAIDQLARLPPWSPTAFINSSSSPTTHDRKTQLPAVFDGSIGSTTSYIGASPPPPPQPPYSYAFGGSDFLDSSTFQDVGTIKPSYLHQQGLHLSLQSFDDHTDQNHQIPIPDENMVFYPVPPVVTMSSRSFPAPSESQFFNQREPLQSSNNITSTMSLHQHRSALPEFPSGDFSIPTGFCINPGRIQGEDDDP